MTKWVQLDDEVWEELQARAEPLVDDINSVVRRLLEHTPETTSDEADEEEDREEVGLSRGTPGYLLPYINSGRIDVGTLLTWERPHVGLTHHAVVTENGRLHVEGHPHSPFKSPSGAARAAAGARSVAGWTQAWMLPNGEPLDSIRHA